MSIATLGIDLAKNVFHVHGRDVAGRPVFQKRFSRAALVTFLANLPRCRVGLEVCSGANHWSRTLQALGHDVRLISPQFVKPYVKRCSRVKTGGNGRYGWKGTRNNSMA